MRKLSHARTIRYRHSFRYSLVAMAVMAIGLAAEIVPVILECQKMNVEYCLLDGIVSISSVYTFCFAIAAPFIVLELHSLKIDFMQQRFIRMQSRKLLWRIEIKTYALLGFVWLLAAFVFAMLITAPFVGAVNNWSSLSSFYYSVNGVVYDIPSFGVVVLFFVGTWLMLLLFCLLVQVLYWNLAKAVPAFIFGFVGMILYQYFQVPNVLLSYENLGVPFPMLLSIACVTLILVLPIFGFERCRFVNEKEI